MNFEIAFTTQQIFFATFGILLLIIGTIFLGRFYFTKVSHTDLKQKHQNTVSDSPLLNRNKYEEVDVFKYRDQFLLFSLSLILMMSIGAFSLTIYDAKVYIPQDAMVMEEDIEIEPPRSAEPPPPPPPPPPPVILEVPNEALLMEDEDIEFVDQSVEENTSVEAPITEAKEEEAPLPPPPPPPPPPEPEIEEIFQVVEEMPRFPGCENIADKEEKYACATQKMLEFIYGQINYPSVARENNIQGTVVIRFIVNEKGELTNTEILRDIGGNCGEEAMRVVNLMNQKGIHWLPGKQRGKPVKVRMNLPVKFKLMT